MLSSRRHDADTYRELSLSSFQPEIHSWTGEFSPESSWIIQQHVAQSNVGHVDECLSQWIEYVNIQVLSPVISYKVFSDILENLVKPVSTGRLSSEEVGTDDFT